jgi:uncharacterized protein
MKKVLFCALALAFGFGASSIPSKPLPPRLVNDFAGIFTTQQREMLERRLVELDDSTSNQVAVVAVADLEGMDRAQYAYEIGQRWGVGDGRFDNGVVILVKPRTDSGQGQVFIATGYGLEGALPDAVCRRIVDERMIPRFRDGDYYGGVTDALDVMIPLLRGEYGIPSEERSFFVIIALILIVMIVVTAFITARRRDDYGSGGIGVGLGNGLGRIILLSTLLGRGSSSGSSGRCGSSRGGSSRGGFGGFGGGGFGGGGAGGSW